jgi:predicted CoA-binding protein
VRTKDEYLPGLETKGKAHRMDFRQNFLETESQIRELLVQTRRVAVLGIKTEAQWNQPAFYVPEYLLSAGFEVIPVPVYFPEVKEILGRPVYRSLLEVPGEIDLVDVFRRPQDIDMHVQGMISKKPRVVWFQLGIRNDAAAERLARAGIKVVQDRCLMVDHRKYSQR